MSQLEREPSKQRDTSKYLQLSLESTEASR